MKTKFMTITDALALATALATAGQLRSAEDVRTCVRVAGAVREVLAGTRELTNAKAGGAFDLVGERLIGLGLLGRAEWNLLVYPRKWSSDASYTSGRKRARAALAA